MSAFTSPPSSSSSSSSSSHIAPSDVDPSLVISQGAEGKVYRSSFLKKPSVVKQRVKKNYRLEVLDTKINKTRLLQEAKCMTKARKAGVNVPCIYYVDQANYQLHMERIIGKTLKEILYKVYDKDGAIHYPEFCIELANKVGKSIAIMHDAEVVHGDLTTSNIMVEVGEGQELTAANLADANVVFIDFGLGAMQAIVEDKAVDLYVLERAFLSTHPDSDNIVATAIESYRSTSKKGKEILNKLEKVRQRGRKRDMFG